MNRILAIPSLIYAVLLYWQIFDFIQLGFDALATSKSGYTGNSFTDFSLTPGDYFTAFVQLLLVVSFVVVAFGIIINKKWGFRGALAVNVLVPLFLGVLFLHVVGTCKGFGCIVAGFLIYIIPIVLAVSLATSWSLYREQKLILRNEFSRTILKVAIFFIVVHLVLIGFLQFKYTIQEEQFDYEQYLKEDMEYASI